MGKASSDGYIDGGLDAIAGSTVLHVCSAEPANFAGIAAVTLADVIVDSGDFTKAAGDVSGRKLTVAQQSAVPIDNTGDANHIVLTDGTDIAVTTCTSQGLIAAGTVTVPAWAIEVQAPATAGDSVDMFDTIEYELTATGVAGNKFDLIASATFTHATEASVTVEMFYVGADTWRFRFTGIKQGLWSYTTASSEAQLAGESGAVTVVANADADVYGFFTNSGNKWAVQRGNVPTVEGFIYNTFQHQNNVRTNNTETTGIRDLGITHITAAQVGLYCDEAEENGHNVIFFMPMAASERGVSTISVWTDGEAGTYSPRLDTFAQIDMVLDTARARGIFVDFWLHGDEERGWSPDLCFPGGHQGTEDQRLLRYIAARMGPKPNWTMQFGFDLVEWTNDTEVNEWAAFVNSKLDARYRHMLSGRGFGTTSDVKAYSGVPVPTHATAVSNLASDSGRPHHFAERHWHPDRANTSQILRGMWQFAMAGGHGGHWGIRPNNAINGTDVYPSALSGEEMKTHFAFWHTGRRFLLDMAADDTLVNTGHCLKSAANQHYIIWVEGASSVTVDLSSMSGTQSVIAVDTNAAYSEDVLSDVTPGSGKVITLASSGDWAIAIGSF